MKNLLKCSPCSLVVFWIIASSLLLFFMPYFFYNFSAYLFQFTMLLVIGIPLAIIVFPLYVYLSYKWRLLRVGITSIVLIIVAAVVFSSTGDISFAPLWISIPSSAGIFSIPLILQMFLCRNLKDKDILPIKKSTIILSPVLLLFSFIMGISIMGSTATVTFERMVIPENKKMPDSIKNIKIIRVDDERVINKRLFCFDVSSQDLERLKEYYVWDFLKDDNFKVTTLENSKYIKKYYGNQCPTFAEPVFYEAIHEEFHSHCIVTNKAHDKACYWEIFEKSDHDWWPYKE